MSTKDLWYGPKGVVHPTLWHFPSGGSAMEHDTLALMEKLDQFLVRAVDMFPWDLFPWAQSLSGDDKRVFFLEILQAVQRREKGQFEELLEDWQATAEALSNSIFMQTYQQPYNAEDCVPWEQVRGELNLSSGPEQGGA
jgi:hypothetical protein